MNVFCYNTKWFLKKLPDETIHLGNLEIKTPIFRWDVCSFWWDCFLCARAWRSSDGLPSENVFRLRARGPKLEISTPAARLEKL